MSSRAYRAVVPALAAVVVASTIGLAPPAVAGAIGFGKSILGGDPVGQPTTLQFGPDDRLYVGLINGTIKIFEVTRHGPNDYTASLDDTITSVKQIPNHDDDGTPNDAQTDRLLTGILVKGTASAPVIYATSSDPRIGGGSEGTDLNLDTNSGTLSRLTWNGSSWAHKILVKGLPRSEENHASNGMALRGSTNTLYIAQGGHTNKGGPSHNFADLPEYALSAAILSIDLDQIGNTTYTIPTLNDPDRPGNPDANDPWGGNDGLNQAKVVNGGPVKVYASGFRNAYDLVLKGGVLYTSDNGPNGGWGNTPDGEGPGGTCTNEIVGQGQGGTDDSLHRVTAGYYGGHPNPTRGNKDNTFAGNSPIGSEHAIECDYRGLDAANSPALDELPPSTNGIDVYTTNNFDGAMKGNLILASFVADDIIRVKLNAAGDAVVLNETLFSNSGANPLDLDVSGRNAPFPGTIWVGNFLGSDDVTVFEPNDFGGGGGGGCTGRDDPSLDEDDDGFDNADEIDNGTNPCSAGDVPPDADGDFTSDRNDPDDDNDGRNDKRDPFAVDADDGLSTSLPVDLSWENDAPDPGGLHSTGFTGLMTNGVDYRKKFRRGNMVVGGAAGVLTVEQVAEGDALRRINTQKYGFQLGVPPQGDVFTVQTRILAPFDGRRPRDFQSMGLFVGPGSQSSYVKVVTMANGGDGGLQFLKETRNRVRTSRTRDQRLSRFAHVDLFLVVDPGASEVQAYFQATTDGGTTRALIALGGPVSIPSGWTDGPSALAVGIISTSRGPAPAFPATWDYLKVYEGPPA
jgi:hypothetical protein